MCALPPCWNHHQIICWHCYAGTHPCRLHHFPCRQYTTTSCHHSQNRRHSINTSEHFTEDGEHVHWHHLPKHAWRSPCSLHPTTTICHPTTTVCCPATTVFHPSTAAIFRTATTKLYHIHRPQLLRPSTRAKMSSRQMSSNDQGLPRHSGLHQPWPLHEEQSDSPPQQCLDSTLDNR
jgi:hypothetical protein